ncbi:uncharacterized protein LOC132617577 [Lycium barbarum]|uniref:uncharacterized protein LOC132617577 n=1 Tax=Lycium barbarum TaxID=112863 RepID=UPI00293F1E24|nr:uncharacterized protein LOC132617577 [Lycium barbarum]
MLNLSKLEFMSLDITGKNYLSWVLDAEIHLDAKDPLELWNNLKNRYEHLKLTVLPKARYDWMHLQLQDFKTVTDSAIHQEQYREKGFKKYADLISCLLVAEQNNTLLAKNHESRPTGPASFPEVNAAAGYDKPERRQNNYRDRGHGRGRGRGRGHGRERGRHNYRQHGETKQETNKGSQNNPSRGKVNMCHRCGMKGHWARICRTPDHFVKLYQASLKGRENNVEACLTFHNNDDEAAPSNKHDDIEANLAYKDDDFKSLSTITHLEAGDFYDDIN